MIFYLKNIKLIFFNMFLNVFDVLILKKIKKYFNVFLIKKILNNKKI